MKIYQVEICNLCNLSCAYCPHPAQTRKKGFMSKETFAQVLTLAQKCGQSVLFLHNFGEPLLHPLLEQFIKMAAEKGIECSFYTNGLLLNRERIDRLFQAGLRKICVSNHVKDATQKVLEEVEKSQSHLEIAESYTPTFLHDWCGQVRYEGCSHICSESTEPCIFERQNAFVVLWSGEIAACCLDCNGISSRFTVEELLQREYTFQKSSLCLRCDLMRGEEAL